MEELRRQGSLTTEDAAALLEVSVSTARRLFSKLEERGEAIRRYGGICLPLGGDYSFDALAAKNVAAKDAIACRALEFLPESGVVYLDGGTTVARFAAVVAERRNERLSIFTNSLVNLSLFAGKCPVWLVGGEYRENRKDFCGFLAEEAIERVHFSACFLGADAFAAGRGFMTTDFETARLNSLVLRSSDLRCALLDASKFGAASFVRYADAADFSLLVSDAPPAAPEAAAFAEAKLRLVTAENQ